MIIVTTPEIPGYKIKEVKGIVTGITARTRGALGKFIAGVQSFLGGEVGAFTKEMYKARIEALNRMVEEAKKLGANAVIRVDFETSEVFHGVVLVSAVGTAVVVEPEH
jgi:uncharacterized protein YbjQ (UPF0145 family)